MSKQQLIPFSDDPLQHFYYLDNVSDMITVYRVGEGYPNKGYFVLCGLIPKPLVEQMLVDKSYLNKVIEDVWFTPYVASNGKYQRFGSEGEKHGFEPLVIHRRCPKRDVKFVELCEDFRLYHNLLHESDDNTYIDENGSVVVSILTIDGGYEVKISLAHLRSYLTDKGLYFSSLFEVNDYYEESLESMGLSEHPEIVFLSDPEKLICCKYQYRDASSFSDYATNRYIRGRRFIAS